MAANRHHLCEDIWNDEDSGRNAYAATHQGLIAQGADIILNLSRRVHDGKERTRLRCSSAWRATSVPLAQVISSRERRIDFDGHSVALDARAKSSRLERIEEMFLSWI